MSDADAVEAHIEGWRHVMPNLDTDAIRTLLLFLRLMDRASSVLDDAFRQHGISRGEFDVLATLVSVSNGRLKPGALARALMMSPAGMTNRIDRLSDAGLVERVPDPADRRSPFVVLTPRGRKIVLAAAKSHEAPVKALLSVLPKKDQAAFDKTLLALLKRAEDLGR